MCDFVSFSVWADGHTVHHASNSHSFMASISGRGENDVRQRHWDLEWVPGYGLRTSGALMRLDLLNDNIHFPQRVAGAISAMGSRLERWFSGQDLDQIPADYIDIRAALSFDHPDLMKGQPVEWNELLAFRGCARARVMQSRLKGIFGPAECDAPELVSLGEGHFSKLTAPHLRIAGLLEIETSSPMIFPEFGAANILGIDAPGLVVPRLSLKAHLVGHYTGSRVVAPLAIGSDGIWTRGPCGAELGQLPETSWTRRDWPCEWRRPGRRMRRHKMVGGVDLATWNPCQDELMASMPMITTEEDTEPDEPYTERECLNMLDQATEMVKPQARASAIATVFNPDFGLVV